MPFVIHVAGGKKSGKTTLCESMVVKLKKRGFRVGFLKHTSENVTHEPEGSDTARISSSDSLVAIYDLSGLRLSSRVQGLKARDIINRFFKDEDIVIVEGGKTEDGMKIWVGPAIDQKCSVRGVIALYASSGETRFEGAKSFNRGDEDSLLDFIVEIKNRTDVDDVMMFVDGERIPAKGFVRGIIAGGITGMLEELKGVEKNWSNIEVHIKRVSDVNAWENE